VSSPYAQKGSRGGSLYAQSGRRGGSVYAGASGPPAAAHAAHHGGLLGGGAHWLGSKAGLAAHDLKEIPAGLAALGNAEYQAVKSTVEHPIVHGKQADALREQWQHPLRPPSPDLPKGQRPIATLVQGMVHGSVESIRHPGRDPFQTLTTVLPLLTGGASAAARAGALADAARAGDLAGAARALVRTPATPPRLLRVGDTQASLLPSKNPAVRAAQGVYDRALQHALDTNPESRLAAHATKRVGGALAETGRYQQRLRDVPAQLLNQRAHALRAAGGKLPTGARLEQAALELASANTPPDVAARFHFAQAADGINPKLNEAVARLYTAVHKRGLLTVNEHGDVVVNAADHPKLALADATLAHVQGVGDQVLARYGVRTPEQLVERVNAAARVRGGEQAPPGRGFVSYVTSEPRAPRSRVAASPGPVVGEARSPITSKAFTGKGIEQGLVPNDVTGQAARHFRQIVRFVNTAERRNAAIRTGSTVRRTSRDVLVRLPDVPHAKLTPAINDVLGRAKLTTDDVAGLHAALQAWHQEVVPGIADNFAADRQTGIGVQAPKGHTWVDRNVLGELGKPAQGPRGVIGRRVDDVNSAVTAATVYFKVGHVGTRVLTNAATNIVQGSASPLEIARSVRLWHGLSDEDKLRALAAAGQHGFAAMPHEGQGIIGRIAAHGAGWWARHADAPFRFNSLAFEARKAGFDTPAKFRQLLAQAEDPGSHGLNAAQTAKVDWVLKRANREQIAYDRLNEFERRYITRGIWFYPWVKGATMFAGNTLLEHPVKAATLEAGAVPARQRQQRTLGELPSYEGGLIPLSGGATPLVTDPSTFSPFATPADVLEVASGKAKLADFLNPALAGGGSLAYKLTPFGGKSTNPLLDSLRTTFGPAWPVQLAEAFAARNTDQSRRMFPKSRALYGTRDPLLRALLGPAVPRHINLTAAAAAARRERTGR
jgi:hypothetical protein